MKRNGFTLIELLVVVAIIGILAAVGTVAYTGYTKAAKVNAVKANHEKLTKYISAELIKCELGGDDGSGTVFKGYLKCVDKNYNNTVGQAAVDALQGKGAGATYSFKNPYDTEVPGITAGILNSCSDILKGTIRVMDTSVLVTITGCASATEKIVSTVAIEQ